jgi:Mg2+ and Co2+ transporter CorA
MANNSDEVKRREQLEHVVGILAEVRSEVKRLEAEVYTLQESELRELGVILKEAMLLMRKLRSDVTLLKLGVGKKQASH